MLKQLPTGEIIIEGEGGASYKPEVAEAGNVFLQAQTPAEIATSQAVAARAARQEEAARAKAARDAKAQEQQAQKAKANTLWAQYIKDVRRISMQNRLFGGLLGQSGFDQNVTVDNYNPTMGDNLAGFGMDRVEEMRRVEGDPDFGQKIIVPIKSLVPVENVKEDYGYPTVTGVVLGAQKAIMRSQMTRRGVKTGAKQIAKAAPRPAMKRKAG